MTKILDMAVTAIRALPESAQETIAKSMLDAAARHKKLNENLAVAEEQLDAGKGIPAEDVLSDLKQRHGA